MTAPRDPNDPASDPPTSTDRAVDTDPSAMARMPLPEPATAPPPPEPSSPPAWTAPAPGAPAWKPARTDDGRGPSIVVGLVLLAVGLWFFAEHTLGLDLPTLRWSQLWPLILIVIGVWVLFGARRRTR